MYPSRIPRLANSTVRYTGRPPVPATNPAAALGAAPIPAPVNVDKITAALDKLTVAETRTARPAPPVTVSTPAKLLAAQRIAERRRRVVDKISRKPTGAKRDKIKPAQSPAAGSVRSTPIASAPTSRSTSFSSVADSSTNSTDSSATTVVPASTRQYGFVFVKYKLNYRQEGEGYGEAHTSELVNFSHSVLSLESRIPAFPADDFLHVRRQASITHGSVRVWLDAPRRPGNATWIDTLAEAEVVKSSRPRKAPRRAGLKVGFARKLIASTMTYEKWYKDIWQEGWPMNYGPWEDPEEDTAKPQDGLDDVWNAAMATKFDDESDSGSE